MKCTSLSLLLFLVFFTGTLRAQISETVWINALSSESVNGEVPFPCDFYVDKSGNSNLLLNTRTSIIDNGTVLVEIEEGVTQLVWLKYSPSGGLIFAHRISPSNLSIALQNDEDGGRITGDALGNTYIMAVHTADVDFGNGVVLPAPDCFSCSTLFLAKFDPAGNALWAKSFSVDDNSEMFVGGIVCDNQGNLLANASSTSNAVSYDGTPLAFSGTESSFLAKFNAQGGLLQAQEFLGISSPYGINVVNDKVYIAGFVLDSMDFGNGVLISVPDTVYNNYYVTVFSKSNLVAEKSTIISSYDYLDLLDMDVDDQGRIYLSVDFSSTVDVNGVSVVSTNTTYAGAMLVLDGDLVQIPLFALSDVGSYPFSAVAVGKDSKYYSAGFMTDSELVIDNNILSLVECADAVVVEGKLNEPPAAFNIGGAGCELVGSAYYGNSIDLDENGSLYISGLYFNKGTISNNFFPGSGFFVAKLNNTTSSTSEPATATGLSVSPNPNSGAFVVQLDKAPDNGRISITDVSGHLMKEITGIQNQQVSLQLDLPNGQYFMQFNDGQTATTAKMTVLK